MAVRVEREAAGVQAGQVQDLLDETPQAQAVAPHEAKLLTRFLRKQARLLVEKPAERPEDERQRRAELVSQVGQEAVFARAGAPKLLLGGGQLIVDGGQPLGQARQSVLLFFDLVDSSFEGGAAPARRRLGAPARLRGRREETAENGEHERSGRVRGVFFIGDVLAGLMLAGNVLLVRGQEVGQRLDALMQLAAGGFEVMQGAPAFRLARAHEVADQAQQDGKDLKRLHVVEPSLPRERGERAGIG